MRGRAEELVPDSLVVLERLPAAEPSIVACSPVTAGRALVTSTYMAGELRRYWAFAATLSADRYRPNGSLKTLSRPV